MVRGKCVEHEWCSRVVLHLGDRQVREGGRGRWCGAGQTVAGNQLCMCVPPCWTIGDGACLLHAGVVLISPR